MQNTASTDQADLVKQNIPLANKPEDAVRQLAQELKKSVAQRTDFYVPGRLKQFMDFFQKCYDYFDETTKAQVSTSQTAEWLLDNFYVVEQAVRQIEEDLPRDYYQRLPKTQDGWARIYVVALSVLRVQHEETRLVIEQIRNFLQIFQEVTPLSTGEIWALPLMLRLAVLESLAEALAVTTKLAWASPPQPAWDKRDSDNPPVSPDIIVANSILNLRLLATQDWKAFFEATSILEKTLREAPAGLYAQMDFETRNRYRSIVEELANGSKLDEATIAKQAIQLAKRANSPR